MKNFLILLFLVLCALAVYRFAFKESKQLPACAEKEFMQGNLKNFVAFKDGILKYGFKAESSANPQQTESIFADEDSSAEIKTVCLPREGSFVYRQFKDGQESLDIKRCGLTCKPYIGAEYAGKDGFSPVFGARLFYCGRWGAGCAYGLKSGCFLSAERRLDDISFLGNTALFLGVNKKTATFGAAVFL